MNKEENLYEIPIQYLKNRYKHTKNCDISIALDLINQLLQQNQKYKEVIDNVSNQIKLYGRYNGEKCTRGFSMMIADFNKLLDILKEVE